MNGILRTLRRYCYWWFRRKYVLEQIKNRKGTCGLHGCCEKMILNCKYFDKETKLCTIWNDSRAGIFLDICRKVYPFDEKDKHPKTKSYCNFYWENKKNG